MKGLFIIFTILLFTAGIAFADCYLACDNPVVGDVITESIVEVNGIEQPGLIEPLVNGTGIKLLNVTTLPKGNYTFRAKWKDPNNIPENQWSDFSVPFVVGTTKVPGGVRVVEE